MVTNKLLPVINCSQVATLNKSLRLLWLRIRHDIDTAPKNITWKQYDNMSLPKLNA